MSKITSRSDIRLPGDRKKQRKAKKVKGLGVTSVRPSGGAKASMVEDDGTRRMPAAEAIELVIDTRHSGLAFAGWLRREKGIATSELRTAAQWAPLVTEFVNRPISGHRRSR